jgi:hypothetical protein
MRGTRASRERSVIVVDVSRQSVGSCKVIKLKVKRLMASSSYREGLVALMAGFGCGSQCMDLILEVRV